MTEKHWSDRAACRGPKAGRTPKERVDNFFFTIRDVPDTLEVTRGRTSNEDKEALRKHIEFLTEICESCPVFSECEKETMWEPDGFFAGRTSRQRERYRKTKKIRKRVA